MQQLAPCTMGASDGGPTRWEELRRELRQHFSPAKLGWYIMGMGLEGLSLIQGVYMGPWLQLNTNNAADSDEMVSFYGLFDVDEESFVSYVMTVSFLVLLVLVFLLGPLGESSRSRAVLLVLSSFACIGPGLVIFFFPSMNYLIGGALVGGSGVAVGLCVTFFNGYLASVSHSDDADSEAPKESTNSTKMFVSLLQTAIGTLALVLIFVAVSFISAQWSDSEAQYAVSIAIMAAWYMLSAVVAFVIGLPTASDGIEDQTLFEMWTSGMQQNLSLFAFCKSHAPLFLVLGVTAILTDMKATLWLEEPLLASNELKVTSSEMSYVLIVSLCTAFATAVVVVILQWRHLLPVVPALAACIGIFAALPFWNIIAMKSKWEFYIFMSIIASVMCPAVPILRALASDHTPKGMDTKVMGFFSIASSITAWCGPLLVGTLNDITGDLRWSICVSSIMCIPGFLCLFLLMRVNRTSEHSVIVE